jgi:probable HAF family extracellular repeat protein
MNRLCEAGVARGRGKAWLLLLAGAAVVGGVCGGAAGQGLAPCRFEVADIIQAPSCGITGPPATIATAISPNGRYVAGYHAQCATSDDEAFIYDRQTREFRTLPRPQGVVSAMAHDVNDSGLTVGGYWSTVGRHGFVYDIPSGQYVAQLNASGSGVWCEAMAINSKGQVCGYRSLDDGGDPVNPLNAFVWEAGKFTDIGVLNGPNSSALDIGEDGTIVGWTGNGETTAGTRGFIWQTSKPTRILPPIQGGSSSALTSVSGQVIACGHGRIPNSAGGGDLVRAFVWRDGNLSSIGVLPGMLRSFALDVGDDQSVIGFCRTLVGGQDELRGYVWQNRHMQDLIALIEDSGPLLSIKSAESISSRGHIAGEGRTSSGVVGFVLVPVWGNEGDVDTNCRTDSDDLILVILEWGKARSPADANGDGVVDAGDLLVVLLNWTP